MEKTYRKLFSKMIEQDITKSQLAKMLKVSERTLNNKLNGITDFKWSEIRKIRDVVAPNKGLDELFNEVQITK